MSGICKLLVGLGNPGAQYAKTRHNIGFMVLDNWAQQFGAAKWRSQFQGLWCKIIVENQEYILLKPQTFMNLSGASVQSAMAYFRFNANDICVIHDDIDLPFASVKMKRGGGAGGHNGLKDIDGKIGKEYWRLRLGVGHPKNIIMDNNGGNARPNDMVSDYVLGNFNQAESAQLPKILDNIYEKFAQIVACRTDKIAS